MGFTTGFVRITRPHQSTKNLANFSQTGGVALTLSIAYLSVLTHQRNREAQGAALRAQALTLQSLVDPIPEPLPPTRSEIASAQRHTSLEVAKDRWNNEVEHAVRWAQTTDWTEVRENAERGASRLWTKLTGETPQEEVRHIEKSAKEKAEAAAGGVADAARAAYSKAKTESRSVEEAAENKALQARLNFKKGAHKAEDVAEDKASEAKSVLASAWESGKDKARDLASKAKAVVGAADQALEPPADGQITPPLDPVQRALHQRYQRPERKVNKTVAEVLKERYTPIDQRDNTVLRGL